MVLKFRYILLLLLLPLVSLPSAGQEATLNWEQIDLKARKAPREVAKNIPGLVAFLSEGLQTDRQKVRSFYTWIVHHILYDQKAYKEGRRRINRNIAQLMKRRKAVCFGYAQLLERFCQEAGIPCFVVSGYVQPSDFSTPNHAWNAVLLDGQWQLMDATWESNALGNSHYLQTYYGLDYFATPARHFLLEHLPADPTWQLLNHPVALDRYRKYQLTQPTDSSTYIDFVDSLRQFQRMSIDHRRLKTAERSFRYNPSPGNRRELAACYIDYETYLSRKAESLESMDGSSDSLLMLQRQMVHLCEKAEKLDKIFDNQIENCAYNRLNYAIALNNQLVRESENLDEERVKQIQEEQVYHLREAKARLGQLPQSIMREMALQQCEDLLRQLAAETK
ncbi:MAG: transglutaminase domain-containing protein [Bacteroidota bacterium]